MALQALAGDLEGRINHSDVWVKKENPAERIITVACNENADVNDPIVLESSQWHVGANNQLGEAPFDHSQATTIKTKEQVDRLPPQSLEWCALLSRKLEAVQAVLPGGQEAQDHTRLSFAPAHTAVDLVGVAPSAECVEVAGGQSMGPLLHPRPDEAPAAPTDSAFNDTLMATAGVSRQTIEESKARADAMRTGIRGR